jgi:hypothetical protein
VLSINASNVKDVVIGLGELRVLVIKQERNMSTSLKKQVGGSHYRQFPIQPIEFIVKNNLPFIEGNIIKYICRWQDKGGIEDLDKVIHYAELLKELKT